MAQPTQQERELAIEVAEMKDKLARVERGTVPVEMQAKGGIDITTLEDAWRFADAILQGNMAPKGMASPGAVIAIIQAGLEIGLSPMFSLSNLTFTNGRLGIMGDAAKALVRSAQVLEPGTDIVTHYMGEPGTLGYTATVVTIRKGANDTVETSFSMADAKQAGLVKQKPDGTLTGARGDSSPWAAYPKRMLAYRAWGFHFRDYFSDVGFGLVVAEELVDYPQGIRQRTRELPAEAPREPDPLLAAATVSPPAAAEEQEPAQDEAAPDAQEPQSAEPRTGDPAAPESQGEDGPEVDPNTGEVIPEWIGRDEQPDEIDPGQGGLFVKEES